jgi:hypothetical protein
MFHSLYCQTTLFLNGQKYHTIVFVPHPSYWEVLYLCSAICRFLFWWGEVLCNLQEDWLWSTAWETLDFGIKYYTYNAHTETTTCNIPFAVLMNGAQLKWLCALNSYIYIGSSQVSFSSSKCLLYFVINVCISCFVHKWRVQEKAQYSRLCSVSYLFICEKLW